MTDPVATGVAVCPECGRDDFASLAGHWARSPECSHPEIDDRMRAVLDALALAGATADGKSSTRLRLWTVSRERALWTLRQLGVLGKAVYREDDTDGQPQYRVVTESHPDLERYRRWHRGVPDTIPAFPPALARVWLPHAASLQHKAGEWPGARPALSISARGEGNRASAYVQVFERAGFTPAVGETAVILPPRETERVLRQVGDPVPDTVYKWCLHREVYAAARDRYTSGDPIVTVKMDRAGQYRALLQFAADALDAGPAALPAGRFERVLAAPKPAEIADLLGGGSWRDALSVAGVRETADWPYPGHPPGSEAASEAAEKYSLAETRAAIRGAAAAKGEPLSNRAYRAWAAESSDRPSEGSVVRDHDGKWIRACRDADVTPAGVAKSGYSREQYRAAIQAAADAKGEPLTLQTYQSWRDEYDGSLPTPSTVTIVTTGLAAYDSWVAACKDAGVQPSRMGRGEATIEAIAQAGADVWQGRDESAPPTVSEYKKRRSRSHPGVSTIYRKVVMPDDSAWSVWDVVVMLASRHVEDA
jgi:hypothetical protein